MNFTRRLIRAEALQGDDYLTGINTAPDGCISSDLNIRNTFFHARLCRVHQRVVHNLARHISSYHVELSLAQRNLYGLRIWSFVVALAATSPFTTKILAQGPSA